MFQIDQILTSYEKVVQLYPHIPSLSLWRTWEYTMYQNYDLPEPILDLGCGNGEWFHLLWPDKREVYGIDMDPNAVLAARASGIYRDVYEVRADKMPFEKNSFTSVFANCSLEHMDHLEAVLENVLVCLQHEGLFLFSVVTDQLLEWVSAPWIGEANVQAEKISLLRENFIAYHHLVNALPLEKWFEVLRKVGFEILEYRPIVPEQSGRLFLQLDILWHTRIETIELGVQLHHYFQTLPNFTTAFGEIIKGTLQREKDFSQFGGVVILARKPGR